VSAISCIAAACGKRYAFRGVSRASRRRRRVLRFQLGGKIADTANAATLKQELLSVLTWIGYPISNQRGKEGIAQKKSAADARGGGGEAAKEES